MTWCLCILWCLDAKLLEGCHLATVLHVGACMCLINKTVSSLLLVLFCLLFCAGVHAVCVQPSVPGADGHVLHAAAAVRSRLSAYSPRSCAVCAAAGSTGRSSSKCACLAALSARCAPAGPLALLMVQRRPGECSRACSCCLCCQQQYNCGSSGCSSVSWPALQRHWQIVQQQCQPALQQ
jgi:hypothetical protein